MKNLPDQHLEFKSNTDMDYYGATGNAAKFLAAAKNHASKVAKDDAVKHKELSQTCLKYFKDDKKIMAVSEKSAEKALKLKEQQDHFLNYGRILYYNGKKQDAISIIRRGIEVSKAKGEPTNMLDFLLRDWGVTI